MPKLWKDTITEHRREVHDAVLSTTADLVAEHGLLSVTMSQIAEHTGIGRATLYKYFPDVEAILRAWHEQRIDEHLTQLAERRDRSEDGGIARLESVLQAFAFISHESRSHADRNLAALLHDDDHVVHAERKVRDMVRDLIADAVAAGAVRSDVTADELAGYCVHALTAARTLPSKAAVHRLVAVTIAGLRPAT
ncbi:MAG TPA: TetR/AcrR family transcriptional regulator [Mycobacteriales bacterium]|nr:TetR/AcrR family transcriptional regulator [Mycobacteriales bacterium]